MTNLEFNNSLLELHREAVQQAYFEFISVKNWQIKFLLKKIQRSNWK